MPGYKLYQSHNVSDFIKELSPLFQNDIFSSRPTALIVQNKNMGEWLKLKLASETGIYCGLSILLPEDAMRLLLKSFLPEETENKNLLYIDNLKVLLYKVIEKIEQTGVWEQIGNSKKTEIPLKKNQQTELYAPLLSYISHENGGVRNKKLFQLADIIAGIFNTYAMNAPDLIHKWNRGELFFTDDKDEELQSDLWNSIFGKEGDFTHIGQLISLLCDSDQSQFNTNRVTGNFTPENLPFSRIILLGSSFLGESGLNLFHYTSRFIEVHHLAFTPSIAHTPGFPPDSSREENLILKKCGALTLGLKKITDSRSDIDSQTFYKTHFNSENSGKEALLSGLHNSIINDTPSENLFIEKKEEEFPTLKIHGCVGEKREIELVRNEILRILDTRPDIRLTDISVMAPNINNYAPHILSLFPEFDSNGDPGDRNIPFNLIDLNSSENLPFIEGFKILLKITDSRFKRSELFNLFRNPCFIEGLSFNKNDPEIWLSLVEKACIKWGYDEENQNQSRGKDFISAPEAVNTWEAGFSRIIEGFAYPQDFYQNFCQDFNQDSEREFAQESDITVVESEGKEETASAGRMIWAVRKLFADLSDLSQKRFSLKEGIILIEKIMERYLGCRPALSGGVSPGTPINNKKKDSSSDVDSFETDRRCRSQIKGIFRDLIHIDTDLNELNQFEDKTFPFSVIRTLITEKLDTGGGSRGRYLTNGVTCSSLKPLRSIPFKVIFLCGMNGGVFPRKRIMPGFDLTERLGLNIDSSAEAGDRFSFLEALMGAEEQLIITYKEKNEITGEAMPPSVIITELLASLPEETGKIIHRSEKVQPFDAIYFSGDNRQSYIENDFKAAEAYYRINKNLIPPILLPVSFENKNEAGKIDQEKLPLPIDLLELIRFISDPIEHYFRSLFGLYLRDFEDPAEDDLENRDVDFFARLATTEDLFFTDPDREPKKIEAVIERKNREGSLISGLSTEIFREKLTERLSVIQKHISPIPPGLSESKTIVFADYSESTIPINTTQNDNTEQRKAPEIKLPDTTIILTGEITYVRKMAGTDNRVFLYRICSASEPSVRHLWRPYMESLVLAATGTEQTTVIISGNKEDVKKGLLKRTWSHSKEEALSLLSELLILFFENQKSPIALTPVLAEKYLEKEQKTDPLTKEITTEVLSKDRLNKLFPELWNEIISSSYGGDRRQQGSLYNRHFFSRNIPPSDGARIDRFLDLLYRRLI